jgi:hypothetical protein
MYQFTMTKRINAPVETVFDVASDLEHAAGRFRGIVKIELLTPGPVGAGTRWRETRRMMGREHTETLEMTAYDRPRSYTVGCDFCGATMETVFQFTPVEGSAGDASGGTAGLPSSGSVATDLTLDIRCEARSLVAKMMSPLTGLMFDKILRDCMQNDVDDLARAAEARTIAALSST